MKGIAASPGVATRKVCIHKDAFSHIPVSSIEDKQIGPEIARIRTAIGEIKEAIKKDEERIKKW